VGHATYLSYQEVALRYVYTGVARDGNGHIISSATIKVYLAGTTAAASVYTSIASTTAVNSVTSATDGTFTFYTDAFDYDAEQTYKLRIEKSSYTTKDYDNVKMDDMVLGTYTISADKTVTTYLRPPKGVVYSIATGKTLTINGPFEAGLYQVFNCVGTGKVVFGNPTKVYAAWFYSGTGDYAPAINSAIASIKAVGGKVVFDRAAELTTPIDATLVRSGVTFEGTSPGIFEGTGLGVILTFKHTGIGFDCTGSIGLTFRDFTIKGHASTTPKVGFLLARETVGSGAGSHKFFNVQTEYGSKFSIATLYSYGSEVNDYFSCYFINSYTGGKTFYSTAYNTIHPVTSSFVTIASGAKSNSVTNIYSGYYGNWGGATSDLFYFDSVEDFHVYGGFWFNAQAAANGRSYVYVDTTNTASAIVSIDGVRGEPGTYAPEYGVFFSDDVARIHQNWSISNNRFDCKTNVVYASANSTLTEFYYKNNVDTTGLGVSVKNLTNSNVDVGTSTFTVRASGVPTGCYIMGNLTAITLTGTPQRSIIFDKQTGEFIRISSPAALANSTTPSIAGGNLYWLAPYAVTITNFTGGFIGTAITILGDSTPTITDGTNIFLAGSTNFTMGATDSLTLIKRSDSKWYEISRSVN
jgi:hypothetical protein